MPITLLRLFSPFLFFCFSSLSHAATPLEVQRISENVYALVGEMAQRSDSNIANNATFGVIVTKEGVVLVDPGGTYLGAKQIDETIKTLTDKPVVLVINSGGQDHRWLGNGYFKAKGAKVIAAEAAVKDHKARLQGQMLALQNFMRAENLKGTEAVYADETFAQRSSLSVGGEVIELIYVGPAHTPGDTLVWLPEQRIVFSGDVVYVERMLGVGPMSNSRNWVEAFEKLAELKPKWIVPGHGHVTTLKQARAETYDYLQFLRQAVATMLDDGIGMERIGDIDQSRFSYLKVYEEIKGRNAQQVYTEMEWE